MNISKREDSLQIQTYIENSKAIFDSLIRYEFAKKKIVTLNNDKSLLNDECIRLRASAAKLEFQMDKIAKKYKNANRERWIYRVAICSEVLLVALLIL